MDNYNAEVTKDMVIADLLEIDEGVAPILMVHGLHCFGCAMSADETLEEACMVHGIDIDALLHDVNRYFNEGSLYE